MGRYRLMVCVPNIPEISQLKQWKICGIHWGLSTVICTECDNRLVSNKSFNSRRELLKLLKDNVWSTYEPESEEGKLFTHLKTVSFHFDGDKGLCIVFMIEKFLKIIAAAIYFVSIQHANPSHHV
jgi:hypothetical protein